MHVHQHSAAKDTLCSGHMGPPSYKGNHDTMKPTANKRFMMHLASIQRVGPLVIVGGLRTSRTDTLCTHANILLVHLKLDKSCHRAAVRMTTLLHSHPVTKFYHRAAKHRVKHHKSPLHQLTLAFDTVHEDYECNGLAPSVRLGPLRFLKSTK